MTTPTPFEAIEDAACTFLYRDAGAGHGRDLAQWVWWLLAGGRPFDGPPEKVVQQAAEGRLARGDDPPPERITADDVRREAASQALYELALAVCRHRREGRGPWGTPLAPGRPVVTDLAAAVVEFHYATMKAKTRRAPAGQPPARRAGP